jgi:hypothetical protein
MRGIGTFVVSLIFAVTFGAATAHGANPTLVNRNDFRVRTVAAVISSGTSTIEVSGTMARDLAADGWLVKLRPVVDVEQVCRNVLDPATTTTVRGSFSAFSPEVSMTVNQPVLTDNGGQLAWSAHVAFVNPTDPVPGFYNICPAGYAPVPTASGLPFTVVGAGLSLWPSLGLTTSPPPTKQGVELFFSYTFAVGITELR